MAILKNDTALADGTVIKTALDGILSKTNTTAFTPTGNYQPATKKYVDDSIPTTVAQLTDASNYATSTALTNGLSGKQATIVGAATTITSSNLTASRALISNTNGKVGVSTVTSSELEQLSGIQGNVQTLLNGKAPTHNHDAYVNQNAFSNITVGTTTVAADTATDTLTLVAGNNVTITPDATNDKITIASTDTIYTHPTHTAQASGLYKITVNNLGHVTAASPVAKTDITGLGIPGSDTNTAATLDTTSTTAQSTASDESLLNGTVYLHKVSKTGSYNDLLNKPTSMTPKSHNHGNISNTGAIGNAADKAIITTTNGVLTAGTVPIAAGGTGATTASGALTNLGITATAAELNYVDGVTSNVQTQLNAKAASSHAHGNITNAGAIGTASGKAVITTTNGVLTTGTVPVAAGGTGATTAADALTNLGLTATAAELNYTAGVTSAIQTQLDNKAAKSHTHGNITNSGTLATANAVVVTDGNKKVVASTTVTAADLENLSGVTSNIQEQLDAKAVAADLTNGLAAKQATITGAATTITGSNLIASRAVISNASGKVAVSNVTSTELGYLSGVTSAIQTQLNGKAPAHNHDAYANQNAFSNIKVGTTTVAADTTTDTLEIAAGSNITVTPDATNDKITIAASVPTTVAQLTDAGDYVKTTDGRLSDARTPLAHAHGNIASGGTLGVANSIVVTDANKKIATTAVASLTELGYLSGVTSGIQEQLNSKATTTAVNAKQNTITGAATTITGNNLTIDRALISNGSGKVAVSAVTSTELGYLAGVTSGIQAQINARSKTDHKHTEYTNQNAFSTISVKVGENTTALAADSITDTLTITAGANVALTSNAETDTLTISAVDTTYTGTAPITVKEGKVSHNNSGATAGSYGDENAQTPNYGGTFNVPYITVNSTGHVTGISHHTVKIPASDNTDTKMNVTLGTTTKAYLVGVSTTPTSTAQALTGISDTGVYLDTTAGQLVASKFKGALVGNADTTTKLKTARTINGTSFDGSGNITTTNWGTARNIYIASSDGTGAGSAVSVNGGANATLKLPGTIKASLTGNADTATKLKTARTISLGGILSGSASFDGSGNVTITAAANDITTITKTLAPSTNWSDTGIAGNNLSTGSYIVQMLINDGTINSSEYYTGNMSWYDGTCTSGESDEMLLHKAGKASGNNHVYLRVLRVANGSMKLQIASSTAFSTATSITFKFRKMI